MKGLIRWYVFWALMGWLCIIVVRADDKLLIKKTYVSISVRTAKEIPNPTDYETKAGIESIYGSFSLKSERENGVMYEGIHLKTEKTKIETGKLWDILSGISAEIEIDTSRDLHEQWLYYGLLDIFDMAFIRLSNRWDRWDYSGALLGATGSIWIYDVFNLKASFDTNFHDQRIFKSEMSATIYGDKDKKKGYYVKPLLIYEERDGLKFIQYKLEVGWKS